MWATASYLTVIGGDKMTSSVHAIRRLVIGGDKITSSLHAKRRPVIGGEVWFILLVFLSCSAHAADDSEYRNVCLLCKTLTL